MTNSDDGSTGAPSGLESLQLDRRTLLVASGAGAALLTFERSAGAALPVIYPMSLGFVEPLDGDSLKTMPWSTNPEGTAVEPATKLISGDQNLALSPVTVRIVGLYPSLPWPQKNRLNAIDLDACFEPEDPQLPPQIPFAAWGYRRLPARNLSPPIHFRMEMGVTDGLAMKLRVQDKSLRWRQYETRFTVDWTAGMPRLMRGIYLLGLDPGTWDDGGMLPPAGSTPDYSRRSVILTVDPVPLMPPA
jgi:hypothetical protein